MEWMYKRKANLLVGSLIPMYHHHYRHHHHQEQQRHHHHHQPASRDVDPNGAVEALHGGANRGLQLVDVQSPVQRLQDRQFKMGPSNNLKPDRAKQDRFEQTSPTDFLVLNFSSSN